MKYLLWLLLAACGSHQVKLEPVTVAPIHVTVDVNVHDDPPKQATTK